MQEDLGLYRGAQALTVIVNGNLKPAILDAVTQLRAELTIDEDQTHGIHGQCQGITLRRADVCQAGDKLAVQQAIKRRVFPVLLLA